MVAWPCVGADIRKGPVDVVETNADMAGEADDVAE